MRALGLDFGTTNTVLSRGLPDGTAKALALSVGSDSVEALRSALCFWDARKAGAKDIRSAAGPHAIQRFIDDPEGCRFLQSMKTFAASPLFEGTMIFGKRWQFEDILHEFIARLRDYAEGELADLPKRLVMGRPVAFAGYRPDPALATKRYESAMRPFGFTEILYVYEPVAAAFFYARSLRKSANVLVADFGGGTTDYSIMRFEVAGASLKAEPLGHGGVGIAGDHFDYRIIDRVILPELGKGSLYQSMGKQLELPQAVFSNFARWNLLSVLRTSSEFRDLKNMVRFSLESEKLERLIDLVEGEQAYSMYRAVSEAKARLSRAEQTELVFPPLGKDFRPVIHRAEFESWIEDDLGRIRAALDETLQGSGMKDREIDKVFLTGGASFTPAVRRIFLERFGPDRIESGDELLSIANGLAIIGARDDAEKWAVDPEALRAAAVGVS